MAKNRKEFKQNEVSELLVQCHRRCCICHRFCGVKMEIHHIGNSSDNDINNAIPLCFECHAEVALYNPGHPKGRKYKHDELKLHRDQWIRICASSAALIETTFNVRDVGPLESLLNELEFNKQLTDVTSIRDLGPPFEVRQFERCIQEGIFSLIDDEIKNALFAVYRELKDVNISLELRNSVRANTGVRSVSGSASTEAPFRKIENLRESLGSTLIKLRNYLNYEIEPNGVG